MRSRSSAMKLACAKRWSSLAAAVVAVGLAACSQPASNVTQQPEPDSTYQADPNAAGAPPVTWDGGHTAFVQNGKPLRPAKLWRFAGSTDGFTVPGAVSAASADGLTIENKLYGAFVRTPDNLALDGRRSTTILVRITRDKPGTQWDPIVYYTTTAHAETETFKAKLYRGHNPVVGETTVLVYDMRHLAAGGSDWVNSKIRQIRFQTDDQPGGAFTIRDIAITEPLPR
jgi:hypothetical protein